MISKIFNYRSLKCITNMSAVLMYFMSGVWLLVPTDN